MNFVEVRFSDGGPKSTTDFHQSRGGDPSLTAGKRALIVDDEILVAWHLESVLEDLHMEICCVVSNGLDAVSEAMKESVDIVFMDVNLGGGIDGVEAARRIRELRNVPIIFVTAYASDEAMVSRITSTLGPSAIVGKPATPTAIQHALLGLGKN